MDQTSDDPASDLWFMLRMIYDKDSYLISCLTPQPESSTKTML